MSSKMRSLVFAACMCIVCSLLLTTASTGLQKFQQRNMLLDKKRNLLMAVGLLAPGTKYNAEAIERIYVDNIRTLWADSDGNIIDAAKHGDTDLPIYLYEPDNKVAAYIVPINSRGLWGRIYGYLALKSDGSTVSGFTVYKHSETPGLGGEIEKRWFQQNWVGKKIVTQEGEFVSVGIAKGKVEGVVPEKKRIHFVDGISGATLTGKYLTAGIEKILTKYEPVSIRFRKNVIKVEP
jgi:Na+-transporting NADH:ubiquinone oxidoreductase subunit C